jgi:hypothetical protein
MMAKQEIKIIAAFVCQAVKGRRTAMKTFTALK